MLGDEGLELAEARRRSRRRLVPHLGPVTRVAQDGNPVLRIFTFGAVGGGNHVAIDRTTRELDAEVLDVDLGAPDPLRKIEPDAVRDARPCRGAIANRPTHTGGPL